jgi:flagellar basal body-associated protein FliL
MDKLKFLNWLLMQAQEIQREVRIYGREQNVDKLNSLNGQAKLLKKISDNINNGLFD